MPGTGDGFRSERVQGSGREQRLSALRAGRALLRLGVTISFEIEDLRSQKDLETDREICHEKQMRAESGTRSSSGELLDSRIEWCWGTAVPIAADLVGEFPGQRQ